MRDILDGINHLTLDPNIFIGGGDDFLVTRGILSIIFNSVEIPIETRIHFPSITVLEPLEFDMYLHVFENKDLWVWGEQISKFRYLYKCFKRITLAFEHHFMASYDSDSDHTEPIFSCLLYKPFGIVNTVYIK